VLLLHADCLIQNAVFKPYSSFSALRVDSASFGFMLQEATAAAAAAAAGTSEQQQQQQQGQQQQSGDGAGISRRQRKDRQHGNNMQPHLQQQQRNGVGGGAADNRILILFDLNGVLTDHTPARNEGRYVVRRTHLMLAGRFGSAVQ
jgi:hypothetical protein